MAQKPPSGDMSAFRSIVAQAKSVVVLTGKLQSSNF